MLIEYWIHESYRIFHDRLIDQDDKNWFTSLIGTFIGRVFDLDWSKERYSTLLFGDYTHINK